MSLAAEADLPLRELLDRQQALLAELRDVEHWRRLAAGRLDLAVAAVTDIDELAGRALPCTRLAPYGLRSRIGIPDPGHALPETAALLRLRSVLDELETYAMALRHSCAEVSREVLQRLDADGDDTAAAHRDHGGRPGTPSDDGTDHGMSRRAVTPRTRGPRRTGHNDPRTSRGVIIGNVWHGDRRDW